MRTALSLAVIVAACTPAPAPPHPGQRLLGDSTLGGRSTNAFSCTTCHGDDEPGVETTHPGRPLGGAVHRGTWWAGETDDLLGAVEFCVDLFLEASPLEGDSPDGIALIDWLWAIENSGPQEPIPTTVRGIGHRPDGGSPDDGEAVYQRACRRCHGEATTGEGHLGGVPILPEAVLEVHGNDRCEGLDVGGCGNQDACVFASGQCRPAYGPEDAIGDKVRLGRFLDGAGTMPFFSVEVLDDASLADLTAWLLDRAAPDAR